MRKSLPILLGEDRFAAGNLAQKRKPFQSDGSEIRIVLQGKRWFFFALIAKEPCLLDAQCLCNGVQLAVLGTKCPGAVLAHGRT